MLNDNYKIINILHQLVDNLKPILDNLDTKTVPSIRVTLTEDSGRAVVLVAGIEFERPTKTEGLAAHIITDSPKSIKTLE
jgi:hypothetical protein